ncbi:hypothetical protein, partial [Pseudomonas syringae]|uniref:hypothetical protein n=1 Tax=Pseudomonas syringae TaxID=317 RepID=UPI0012FD880A
MSTDKNKRTVIDASVFRTCGLDFMRNINKPYTLYYDETNNIRSLSLTETGLNHEILDCFVLGGLALECGFHGHPATHSMNIRPLIPR